MRRSPGFRDPDPVRLLPPGILPPVPDAAVPVPAAEYPADLENKIT